MDLAPPPPHPVTHARLFAIAAPAIAANITTPLMGIVGTAVIGRLGEAHLLGGVAMSAVVFDLAFWLFGFLRMGTVALTAQALGAGDHGEERAVLARALIIALVIGVAVVALQRPLAQLVYGLMGGSPAVTAAASTYFLVRIWSTPCALGNYAVLGWLIGLARVRIAVQLQIAINTLTIALTALLVLGLDLGVAGAALAAVIAEAAGLGAGLVIAWRLIGSRFDLGGRHVLDRARLMRMLAVNRDILIRTAALIAAFFFFTATGARAGDVTLAGNAVLNNLMMFASFFLDGFATAAEQLCGYAVGARNRTDFERAVRLAVGWGFGFALPLSLGFLVGGTVLIDLMTTSPQVRETARQFLLFAALAPTAGVLAYAFDGVYVGATWSPDMRNLMLAALACYLIAWWVLQSAGNAGLWTALLVFHIARGLFQAARYPALVRATFP